jgi:hypothetical protein
VVRLPLVMAMPTHTVNTFDGITIVIVIVLLIWLFVIKW